MENEIEKQSCLLHAMRVGL